jgi:hypothetical protein
MDEERRGPQPGGAAPRRGADKHHRRVGKALSLSAFAKAKKSGYDPRVAKEKERALAARTVNKYRKLQKRLEAAPGAAPGAAAVPAAHAGGRDDDAERAEARPAQARAEAGEEAGSSGAGKAAGRRKPPTALERVAARAQEAKDAARAERDAAWRQAEERAARLATQARARRDEGKLYRKRNAHGQPVMRGRIEKLLSQLEGGK